MEVETGNFLKEINSRAGRLLSSYEVMLLFQNTQVQFPSPASIVSILPVTQSTRHPTPKACKDSYTHVGLSTFSNYTYTHMVPTHTHTQSNKNKSMW